MLTLRFILACFILSSGQHREDHLPVVDNMRRYMVIKRIPWPWLRRDTTQNESSPLIPKEGSAKEDAEELSHVTTDLQSEANNGQDQGNPAFTRIHPRYRYSLMDYLLKYLLFLCNLLFTVLGLVVLGLGMWGLISKESFEQEKISSIGTDPMLILVTLGLLLTMLCLSGCVGALRENCCLLKLFSAAVLVLITVQVLFAILAYSMQDQIGGYLRSGMLAAMAGYQDDLDLRFITDEIQSNLQCCGADNYRDWEINIYYNCSAPGVLACGVPATCCVDPLENGTVWNSQCGVGAQLLDEFTAQSVIFLGGCLGGISRWIEQHEGLIGTVAVVAIGVQIMTLFITTRLLESIQWHKVNI
ncbi:tetraspanin-10 [Amphiprion ocellaris]|uniref:Tetraspanin-10 n=1 Tax=Amphiprion ocellaris TaxID=80972 RepID=A0AAQ5XFC2_AMPOC|nr:tetraspanin-10 [Amphiprion ocellaris]